MLLVAPARAACEPATVVGDVSQMPQVWQQQLRALVRATAEPGQPWGCPGAALKLEVFEVGAALEVRRPGGQRARRMLSTPDDLVPSGKALLARAASAPAPELIAPALAVATPLAVAPIELGAAAPPEARALVEATGELRYLGSSEVVMVGAGVRAAVPFGRWRPELWGRYAASVADAADNLSHLEVSELAVGGGCAYVLIDRPLTFGIGLRAALAVIDMEAHERGRDKERGEEYEGAAVDGRVGMNAHLAVPLADIVSLVGALDIELAPASLADSQRRIDPMLPVLPGYTTGLAIGVQVAIP